jgi:hypothetical protein
VVAVFVHRVALTEMMGWSAPRGLGGLGTRQVSILALLQLKTGMQ